MAALFLGAPTATAQDLEYLELIQRIESLESELASQQSQFASFSLAGAEQQGFFDRITQEFELASGRILEVKQLDRLLDDQRVLQRNIRLRNPYVDPLHLLQIDLLQRWRQGGREDDELLEALKATVKGIALGIQNTG